MRDRMPVSLLQLKSKSFISPDISRQYIRRACYGHFVPVPFNAYTFCLISQYCDLLKRNHMTLRCLLGDEFDYDFFTHFKIVNSDFDCY